MAGANLIYGLGMIEMGMTIDFGQLVMDNEFARMIKFVCKGIPVNDEMLAADVIHEIGIGKDFLGHDQHLQPHEIPIPAQTDRPPECGRTGRRRKHRYVSKGQEEARHILETHKPDPLPDDVLATMRSIVEEAEEELGVVDHKADN